MLGGSDAYPETAYFTSENGWMTSVTFLNWFKTVFLKNTSRESHNVLIYDGHLSHISIDLIESAISNKVTILKLPPHTSHILQPLDVSVFYGLKCKWDDLLTQWARQNIGKRLSKSNFADILGKTWIKFNWNLQLKSGFKYTGIFYSDIPTRVNEAAIPEKNYDPEKLKRYKKFCAERNSQKNDSDDSKKQLNNDESSQEVNLQASNLVGTNLVNVNIVIDIFLVHCVTHCKKIVTLFFSGS